MNDFSCMCVTAVSFHFISPSIISPFKRAVPARLELAEVLIFLHVDLREPLDVGHAVPARHDQPQREALVLGERLAVQRVGQERLGRQRLLARQAAAELLFDLELLRPRHSTSSSP